MADEFFDQIAVPVDGWSMISWLGLWNVIELVVASLMIGFVLGYLCAVKFESSRAKDAKAKSTCTIGTQSKGPPSRTIGAQSQCTYKRKLVTPRFQVLPQLADGVFDVSFSD